MFVSTNSNRFSLIFFSSFFVCLAAQSTAQPPSFFKNTSLSQTHEIFSSKNQTQIEIQKRVEDIERIKASIEEDSQKLEKLKLDLEKTESEHSLILKKIRNLIILRDKISRKGLTSFFSSFENIVESFFISQYIKTHLQMYFMKYSQIDKQRAALIKETQSLKSNITQMQEIKTILEKRIKELQNTSLTLQEKVRSI